MGPFLVFPTGAGVFRSHRNNTPAKVGPAALSALPPDPVVTVAPDQAAQPLESCRGWAAFNNLHCTIQLACVFAGAGGRRSQNLRYFHLFVHLFTQHTFSAR